MHYDTEPGPFTTHSRQICLPTRIASVDDDPNSVNCKQNDNACPDMIASLTCLKAWATQEARIKAKEVMAINGKISTSNFPILFIENC